MGWYTRQVQDDFFYVSFRDDIQGLSSLPQIADLPSGMRGRIAGTYKTIPLPRRDVGRFPSKDPVCNVDTQSHGSGIVDIQHNAHSQSIGGKPHHIHTVDIQES